MPKPQPSRTLPRRDLARRALGLRAPFPRRAALALCALAALAGCGEDEPLEQLEITLAARSLFFDPTYLGEALGVEMHRSPWDGIGQQDVRAMLRPPESSGVERDFALLDFVPVAPEEEAAEEADLKEQLRAEARKRMAAAEAQHEELVEKTERKRRKRVPWKRPERYDLRLVLIFNSGAPVPPEEACKTGEVLGADTPVVPNGFTADLALCRGFEPLATASLKAIAVEGGRDAAFVQRGMDRLMVAMFGTLAERRALGMRNVVDDSVQ